MNSHPTKQTSAIIQQKLLGIHATTNI